eukprot:CAMPEP_0185522462 /NCGR_PEP_ID=MMETSP1366-20130426/82877_1 /TAXON_ID=38817 /ORGANISM="Gephyrocapsa oceanica, Strain RCC1303" /LENGTH=131 /DNA_ID=CAMNT_0028133707 /DNA_START=13 /DNA_END=405 /DNA_ORIENTATION=-
MPRRPQSRQQCKPLLDDGLSSHAAAPRLVRAMLCSERYATEVSCGNHTFLFTRHDPGDSRHYDTRVRTLEPRDHLLGDLGFSRPHRGLPAELLMSHNAAVICEDDQLVAFGGMAHPPRHLTHIPEAGEDWL